MAAVAWLGRAIFLPAGPLFRARRGGAPVRFGRGGADAGRFVQLCGGVGTPPDSGSGSLGGARPTRRRRRSSWQVELKLELRPPHSSTVQKRQLF